MGQETRAVFLRYGRMDPDKMQAQSKAAKTDKKVAEMEISDVASFKDGIPAEVINEINDITIRRMVMSIDGKTGEQAFDFIMDDLRQEDYQQIIEKCNEISAQTQLDDDQKKA